MYKAGTGWLLGINAQYITDSQVVIKGCVSFNRRSFSENKLSMQDVSFINHFSLQEFSFDLAIGRQLRLSSMANLLLMIGSSYSMAVSGSNKQEYWIAEPTFSQGIRDRKVRFGSGAEDEFKRSYWAIVPSIGFLLKDKWMSTITYSHGLNNIFPNETQGAKYRYRSFKLSVGYNLHSLVKKKRGREIINRKAF